LDEASLLLQSIGLDDRCSEIPIDSRMRQRLIDIVSR